MMMISRRCVCLAATLVAMGLAPTASRGEDGPSAVVYVESNIGTTPGVNSIFGFRRDLHGKLTRLPGSPFSTDGTGVGPNPTFALGPYDSDQNMIADEDGQRLFAVNSGSNTIAVFDIQENGELTPVPGSPFHSGGVNPVSVGLADDVLCVVNKSMDPNQPSTSILPNYTTFRVTERGGLSPVAASTVSVAANASPTQALVGPEKELLFGADFFGGVLQSFRIGENGRLVQNPPQVLPASEFVGSSAPRFPLGLGAHPKRRILYVGFVTINRLGVYMYNEDGQLLFVRTVADSGVAICWVRANAKGDRLYATNTADGSVSVFDSTDPLHPFEIQKVTLAGQPNSPFQLELDRRNQYLYVVSQFANSKETAEANALHVLKLDSQGKLEQVDRVVLPVPAGARPQGIVAF